MDPATVTIQLTPDDLRNFSQFVAQGNRKLTWILFVVILIVFIGISLKFTWTSPLPPTVMSAHKGPPAPSRYGWVPIVLALTAIVAGKLWIRWLTGRPGLYKKTSPAAFDPKTYTILDQGLRCQCELGESMDYWPAIVRFVETADYFFIMVAARRGHVLPRRCFPTAVDAAIFGKQVRLYLEVCAPAALSGAVR